MRGEAGFYTRRMTFVGIAVRRMSKNRELQSMAALLGWDGMIRPHHLHVPHTSLVSVDPVSSCHQTQTTYRGIQTSAQSTSTMRERGHVVISRVHNNSREPLHAPSASPNTNSTCIIEWYYTYCTAQPSYTSKPNTSLALAPLHLGPLLGPPHTPPRPHLLMLRQNPRLVIQPPVNRLPRAHKLAFGGEDVHRRPIRLG